MYLEQKLKSLHAEAHQTAFAHYVRKGTIPPRLTEILAITQSIAAFIAYSLKYSDDQPRVPAGSPDGGQWTNGDDGSDSGDDDGQGDNSGENNNIQTPSDTALPQVTQEIPPSILLDEPPVTFKLPYEEYPTDPNQPPAPGFEWQGRGTPESGQGNWHNSDTGENLHPDLNHAPPKVPHWDYDDPNGNSWRLYPDGRIEAKPSIILTT